jgi:bifunctional pyridoxal-dependent enzyme with beta-cystathionase and maltose regulon repressor activities
MAPPALDPAYKHEVESLRQHVDAKFEGLSKWIETVSTAIEKMSDQRDRIIVLEEQYKSVFSAIQGHGGAIEALKQENKEMLMRLIKISAWISAGIGTVALILPILVDKVLK